MNILIAVVGEAWTEAVEKKIQIAREGKMFMLRNFNRFLKRNVLYNKENVFMIIVSLQQEDEDEDSAGTGIINKIVKQNAKEHKKLKKEVTKNINKFVEAKIVSVKDSVEAKVEGVEAKVVGV